MHLRSQSGGQIHGAHSELPFVQQFSLYTNFLPCRWWKMHSCEKPPGCSTTYHPFTSPSTRKSQRPSPPKGPGGWNIQQGSKGHPPGPREEEQVQHMPQSVCRATDVLVSYWCTYMYVTAHSNAQRPSAITGMTATELKQGLESRTLGKTD